MRVNLLPPEFNMQLLLRRRVRTWLRLWSICLLFCVGMVAHSGGQVHRMDRKLDQITTLSQPISAQQHRVEDFKLQLARLEARNQATEQLMPPDRTLPLLAILSQSAAKAGGNLQIQRLSIQSIRPRATEKKVNAAEPEAAILQVSLGGMAANDQVVSQFVSLLQSYGVFSAVELKSSSEVSGSGQFGRQFQLEIRS